MGIKKDATLARTQAAKKKAKKKKKKKKKKAKKVKYVGGKRAKGQHKSKAMKASGKKSAAALKKKGVGLFAVKTLTPALAAITGKNKMSRVDAVKAVWVYIKKKGLSKGRNVGAIPGVFSGGSMFKLAGAMSKHFK